MDTSPTTFEEYIDGTLQLAPWGAAYYLRLKLSLKRIAVRIASVFVATLVSKAVIRSDTKDLLWPSFVCPLTKNGEY